MQSPPAYNPTEDVSARSGASSRAGGESHASYQRSAAHRHSILNVSPSKIQSVRRPSEAALPTSGRSAASSNGWAASSGVATGTPPPSHQVPSPTAVANTTTGASHDEEYTLGLMAEPADTYPAYAAQPGLLLPTGSVTPTNGPLSVGAGGDGLRASPSLPPHTPPTTGLSPHGDDVVHEVLAINTLAMQRCREEQLDEAANLLNEAYLKLQANGGEINDTADAAAAGGRRPSSGGSAPAPPAGPPPHHSAADDDRAAAGPAITDPQLLDELQSITLNNMGVVECHRGQPRQALSHFEAARQLEESWNMGSPSVALNTCAAYNALRMYDKATAAALETIDMLRALAVQRKRQRLLQRRQIESLQPRLTAANGRGTGTRKAQLQARQREEEEAALLLQSASEVVIADSENNALWGAAWHNLAVAQINTAIDARRQAGTANSTRQADTSEMTNTLVIFQNAMRATQDLLGPKHPMTRAVVETYREARKALRDGGAFRQHRGQMTAPLPPVDPRDRIAEEMNTVPAPGRTHNGTLQKQKKDLTITFRGEATNGEKLTERMDAAPYPGAKPESYRNRKHYTAATNFKGETQRTMTNLPAQKRSGSPTQQPASRSRSNKAKMWSRGPLRSMPLGDTLMQASELYGNPHPLLRSESDSGHKRDGYAKAEGTGADGGVYAMSAASAATANGRQHSPTPPSAARPPALQDGADKGIPLRQTRARPPLPENLSNEAYYAHYLALLDERQRLIATRQNADSTAGRHERRAAEDGDTRSPALRVGGGGASGSALQPTAGTPPAVMHYPAGRSTASAANAGHASADRYRDESSLNTQPPLKAPSTHSTAAHFGNPDDHARYLLLAQPPAPPTTSTTVVSSTGASPVATGAEPEVDEALAGQVSPVPPQPRLSSATQTEATATMPSQGVPTRELFDAMWVTTDETVLQRQGKRDFGRPAYYVPTTTLLQTYQKQEEAEAAARQAPGQHRAGPDTRSAVMYYSEDIQDSVDEDDECEEYSEDADQDEENIVDDGDARSDADESGSDGKAQSTPRVRAGTAQHENRAEASSDAVDEY